MSAGTTRNADDLAVVLLAAGASRRFGTDNKLLAPIGGTPLVATVARTVRAALPNATITAVLRADTGANNGSPADAHLRADDVRAVLTDIVDAFCINPDADRGLGSSVACGIAAVAEADPTGAMVVQGDMPGLTHRLLVGLVAAFHENGTGLIVVPVDTTGTWRTPVIWPSHTFADLTTLTGDRGGRALMERDPGAVCAVPFSEGDAFVDIDTVDDLARWQASTAVSKRQG
ncbi:MAG: nucleotidyltransferase family protein [Pseudomonadota bacterium]